MPNKHLKLSMFKIKLLINPLSTPSFLNSNLPYLSWQQLFLSSCSVKTFEVILDFSLSLMSCIWPVKKFRWFYIKNIYARPHCYHLDLSQSLIQHMNYPNSLLTGPAASSLASLWSLLNWGTKVIITSYFFSA